MTQGVALGVQAEHPRRIVLQDAVHLANDPQALRGVVHVLHPGEQAVERRVGIVGRVLAPLPDPRLVAMQQEEEVFRIGVIGIPAQVVKLDAALAQLVLEAVEIGSPNDQLDVDLGKLPGQPVEARFFAHAAAGGIEIDHQRLARLFMTAVRIAGLDHQLPGQRNRLALRLAILPVVDHRIDPGFTSLVAKNARRQRALRGNAPPVLEDGDELLLIDGDRDRLAQLGRPLVEAADHAVEHVEAHVEGRGLHGSQQADAFVAHLVGQGHVTTDIHAHGLVETVGRNARGIVVALQKLVPVGNGLFLAGEHRLVDERQWLAAIGQQPGFPVARFAFAGIGLAVKIGIARQHHAAIRIVFRQHVRPGADRPPVQGQVLRRHARLGKEALDFARHRGEERHGQPVGKLRVFALDAYAPGVTIDPLHAAERKAVEIDPRIGWQALGRLLQGFAQFLEADDLVRHHAEDG